MPPMPYFLSAHASPNAQHLVDVPFPITFYVPSGQILPNDRALQIFKNLAQNIVPGGSVDHTTQRGLVPNYSIWELAEYPDYSGVFAVGSDHRSISLAAYTQQAPLTLAGLTLMLEKMELPSMLYWVACG